MKTIKDLTPLPCRRMRNRRLAREGQRMQPLDAPMMPTPAVRTDIMRQFEEFQKRLCGTLEL